MLKFLMTNKFVRALDSPPTKRRPRAGGTSKAEGRVAGGSKKEGKGNTFLERWLKEGGISREAWRSPEETRIGESKEEKSTQGRKEKLEGRIPASNAEGREIDSKNREVKRFGDKNCDSS